MPEAPVAERFAALRTAAEALLPKEQQGVVLGVVTESGAWHVRAGQEPAQEPSSDAAVLDVKALAQAEAPLVVEAFGAPHAFAAVPLLWKFTRIPGAERLEAQLDRHAGGGRAAAARGGAGERRHGLGRLRARGW